MATLLLDQQIEIPTIGNLADFRRWALSEEFPRHGRIDYITGKVEVEMSPEDLFTHGTLKSEVSGTIKDRVNQMDLGHTLIAETRISSELGELSSEPDVIVITYEAIDHDRVRLVPKASGEVGRYVEVEGGPDLIVEIVSDSSVEKDTVRLPVAYYEAGVREYWLIDARGKELFFQIQIRGTNCFEPTASDADGGQRSQVLDSICQLNRDRHARGHWMYRLRIE